MHRVCFYFYLAIRTGLRSLVNTYSTLIVY